MQTHTRVISHLKRVDEDSLRISVNLSIPTDKEIHCFCKFNYLSVHGINFDFHLTFLQEMRFSNHDAFRSILVYISAPFSRNREDFL